MQAAELSGEDQALIQEIRMNAGYEDAEIAEAMLIDQHQARLGAKRA